jgi:hypothetical protein
MEYFCNQLVEYSIKLSNTYNTFMHSCFVSSQLASFFFLQKLIKNQQSTMKMG